MKKNTKEQFAGTDSPAVPAAKALGRILAGILLISVLSTAISGCGLWSGGNLPSTHRETVPSQPAETTALLQTESPATTAAPDPNSCGKHLTWRFDSKTGLLTIKGSGAMTDYETAEAAPWHPYRGSITEISFPDGLTYIGKNAFASCFSLSYVLLPEGVSGIGDFAFQWCNKLAYVEFPESLGTIGNSAFQGCDLSELPVTLPESVAVIGDQAFALCSGLEEIRILHQNCVIGGSAASSPTTICGFPGSTAEQYADQNGNAFVPIALIDLETVAGWVTRDNEERDRLDGTRKEAYGGVTTIAGVGLVGGRRLAKIVRTVGITASEEEIAQAKKDRLIVLQGEPYSYRDTQEQFELTFGKAFPYTVKEDGFIYLQQGMGNAPFYEVGRAGDSYVFAYDWGNSWSRLEEVTDVAWILLDENTVWSAGQMQAFLWSEPKLWPFVYETIREIRHSDDGVIQIDCEEKYKD